MDALREALADRARVVEVPADAWAENARLVRHDSRRRTGLAVASVVLAATTGVLGFRFVHEGTRGEPVPVQPAGTQQPVPR
jgi:hypothetical protein